MSQEEVLEILKAANGDWLDSHEISKKLKGRNINSVSSNLRKLRSWGFIKYVFDPKRSRYVYKYANGKR